MVRVAMILLCLLLAGAAAGRYQAEVSVRETREEIEAMRKAKTEELSEIQLLRAEIAYLENPDRLALIAARVTELEPLTGAQLFTADELIAALGADAAGGPVAADGTAIALADAGPSR